MLDKLSRLFRSPRNTAPAASVPEGTRYYAIGDIHGRDDLFAALIDAIEADDAAQAPADTTVILLGDLVDRGPDSSFVVARARRWAERRRVRLIAGNHEEMFLESFDDAEVLRHFLRHGGKETVLSYGVGVDLYNAMSVEELQAALPGFVPKDDRAYLEAAEDWIEAGDYMFVHAGVDFSIPHDGQKTSDLRWIRNRFLQHTGDYSHVVVHGHTIFESLETGRNRIGVDTGAYRTGRLTALVLEGSARRTIQAVDREGVIDVEFGGD